MTNEPQQTDGLSLANVKRAIVAAQAGNRPLARLNLENALNSEQHKPDYWLWLAWTTDSPAGAVSALEQALRLSPDHHLAQQGLAWALSMQGYDVDDYIEQSAAVSVEADPIEHELSDQPCDVEAFAMGDREEEPDVDEDQAILEHVTELETSCDDLLPADAILESTPADNTESTSDELDTSASDDDTSYICHMETTEDPFTIPEGDTKRELPSRNDLQEADASYEETLEAAKVEPSGNDGCTQSKCGSDGPAALDAVVETAVSNKIDEIAEQADSVHEADVVATVSQSSERSQPDEGLTVLVVDDSPTIRKIVSMSLEEAGYTVVTASGVMEAIKQMTDYNPSLVLTDISMPDINGYQLCKLIKSHDKTRSIPVIMLSGKDGIFDKIKGKFVGCDDYITKPFQSAELLEKVTSCLPLPVSDSHS